MIEKNFDNGTDGNRFKLLVLVQKNIIVRISRAAVQKCAGIADPQHFQFGNAVFL